MTDRPINFRAHDVLAALAGQKTQHRTVLKPRKGLTLGDLEREGESEPMPPGKIYRAARHQVAEPRYAPGDRLWVREAHSLHDTHGQNRDDDQRWGPWSGLPTLFSPDRKQIAYYREGFDRYGHGRWRPSMYMPRWASRLTLTVTDVRVQRVQEISEEDAIAGGIVRRMVRTGPMSAPISVFGLGGENDHATSAKGAYRDLWNSINGPGSWDANTWVCALTFTVQHGNIDEVNP